VTNMHEKVFGLICF